MKQIPNHSIKKWAYASSNKLSHPVSVAAVCPACSLNVVYNTKRRLYDANRDTSSCSADCPACGETAHFWVTDMVAHARADGEGDPCVFMLPAPSEQMDIQRHQEHIPEGVMDYCKTAQDIYFSGNLMATNVLVKTTLETIFDEFLPLGNSRGTLSMMIRDSISSINHNEPLAKLSAMTTSGGDLHALFQNHHGTEKDTADAMMQLLDALIVYLYVLPRRFRELEEQFKELKICQDKEALRCAREAELAQASAAVNKFDDDYDDYDDTDLPDKAA